jgi:hypothetical protein
VLVGGTALDGWRIRAYSRDVDVYMPEILGFADALVIQLRRLFGCDPETIIARLEVTAGQRELLLDTYHGKGSG